MRKWNFIYLLPALAILSCSKDEIEENTSTEQQIIEITEDSKNVEMAYPDEIGRVSEVFYAGQQMAVEEIDGEFIYQGDIILTPELLAFKRQNLVYEKGKSPKEKAVGRTSGRWPNNTVFYSIDGSLSDKNRVSDAINHWESKTSIKFVLRTNQSNYVYFTTGSGCSSYVGMVGGRQNITLSTNCSTGNTIHEIGHAIGLWHEQSRVDRDRHVKINYSNIQSGREHNFKTYEEMGADGDEFTTNLDFGSIMMYSPYSFSSNGQPTIVKIDGSTYSVQRSALSNGDVTGVNAMYPSGGGEPTYINGEYYTINGITVLRYYDRWYYFTRYGWRTVELVNGYWEFVK